MRCRNVSTYWSIAWKKCIPCDMGWIQPGHEFTPNCGYDDEGGRPVGHIIKCSDMTYNDGRFGNCQRCTLCPIGSRKMHNCSATTGTQCCELGKNCMDDTSTVKAAITIALPQTKITQRSTVKSLESPPADYVPWAVAVVTLACMVVLLITLISIYRRRKRGLCFRGHRPPMNAHRLPPSIEHLTLLNQSNSKVVEDILSPQIQSAPLEVVLDNLDVLEELVMLLDPEGPGVKSTRHLASSCSFHSTWITYTYSMKDSKSPLKAVLERVNTNYPDWTVGHLAKLLKDMGRNDAIAVLAKLALNQEEV